MGFLVGDGRNREVHTKIWDDKKPVFNARIKSSTTANGVGGI